MARSRSQVTPAIVLKRSSIGEADRIVTLLTPELGKVVCVAKGARKMTSSKRSSLEPGNIVRVLLLPTSSLSLLTQATLLADLGTVWNNLAQLRRISQILEIVDKLVVEGESDPSLFAATQRLLIGIQRQVFTDLQIRDELDALIQNLGFPALGETSHANIADYIQELTERELKSYQYLKV